MEGQSPTWPPVLGATFVLWGEALEPRAKADGMMRRLQTTEIVEVTPIAQSVAKGQPIKEAYSIKTKNSTYELEALDVLP